MNGEKDSLEVQTLEELHAWLLEHHTSKTGIWLITFRPKSTRGATLDYNTIVEEALCFGWIDSKTGSVDEDRTRLWLAPRSSRSGWSRSNKERVERLLAQGRMMPPGLAAIERAKENGTWDLLDTVERLEIPPDLEAEFARYPEARANFEAFPRSIKRGILEWIATAKTPPTREKRIGETASLAQQNVRANQWTPKS